MVKVLTANGDLIFGLSALNIERLMQGRPIEIQLADLGLPAGKIFIFYGATEASMTDELKRGGMVVPT